MEGYQPTEKLSTSPPQGDPNYNKDRLMAELKVIYYLALKKHYYCEDGWYSCPLAEEGCADDSQEGVCSCGASKHNEIVKEKYNKIKNMLGVK